MYRACVVEDLGIKDSQDVAGWLIAALVVLVEDFLELVYFGHKALVGPPAGVVGRAEIVIRNCTMNFSADVIFALRQLVCTEVHCECECAV